MTGLSASPRAKCVSAQFPLFLVQTKNEIARLQKSKVDIASVASRKWFLYNQKVGTGTYLEWCGNCEVLWVGIAESVLFVNLGYGPALVRQTLPFVLCWRIKHPPSVCRILEKEKKKKWRKKKHHFILILSGIMIPSKLFSKCSNVASDNFCAVVNRWFDKICVAYPL